MILITIDLESWDRAWNLRIDMSEQYEEVLGEVIYILERSSKKATFFTTLEFAKRFNGEVREISRKYEIASHGTHHRIYGKHVTEKEFAREIEESKIGLEKLVGRINGFRAPAFMFPLNLAEILRSFGFDYDSSVMPSMHIPGWYGYNAPKKPYLADYTNILKKSKNGFPEFPLAVAPIINLPLGGFFLRVMGIKIGKKLLELHAKRYGLAVTYLHLHDLMDLPRVIGVPRRVYFRSGRKNLKIFKELVNIAGDATLSQLLGVCNGGD